MCLISAFRCAYCYFLNPARKTRPQAPRLPEIIGERKMSPEAPLPSSGPDADKQPGLGMYGLILTVRHKNMPLKFCVMLATH